MAEVLIHWSLSFRFSILILAIIMGFFSGQFVVAVTRQLVEASR